MHIHKQSALQTTLALLSVLDKMIPEQNSVLWQTWFVIISETFKGMYHPMVSSISIQFEYIGQ